MTIGHHLCLVLRPHRTSFPANDAHLHRIVVTSRHFWKVQTWNGIWDDMGMWHMCLTSSYHRFWGLIILTNSFQVCFVCPVADGIWRSSKRCSRIGLCSLRQKQAQVFQWIRISTRKHDWDLDVTLWVASHLLRCQELSRLEMLGKRMKKEKRSGQRKSNGDGWVGKRNAHVSTD